MKKKSKKELLMAGGLALEILVVLLFLNARINALLDSDMSSEMVLAQLLAKENAALSTHWYYSTELRVLNTQLLYAFFFKLSNNWHWIRMASIICLWCIIIGIYYFWACAEGCKKYFLITALLLLAPISEDYFRFVLAGVYYIPHIAIAFAALAMNELYMKAQRGSRKLWLVVSVLLAFVAGLGGPREIIALYGPIGVAAAAELLNKKNKTRWQQFIYATFVGAAALLGYALNVGFGQNLSFCHLGMAGLSACRRQQNGRNLQFLPAAVWSTRHRNRICFHLCSECDVDCADDWMHRLCIHARSVRWVPPSGRFYSGSVSTVFSPVQRHKYAVLGPLWNSEYSFVHPTARNGGK